MKIVTLDLIEKMVKGIAAKTAPKVHTHGNGDIISLDAAKLTGKISADRLPDDISNTTVAFTSGDTADADASAWTSVAKLTSGEKQSSLFAKISQMFNNVRWINSKLGRAVLTGIGNGTVTDAICDINDNLVRTAQANGSIDDALEVDLSDPNSDSNWPYIVGLGSSNIPSDFHFGVREVLFLDTNYVVVRLTGVGTDKQSGTWTRAYTGAASGWESNWRRNLIAHGSIFVDGIIIGTNSISDSYFYRSPSNGNRLELRYTKKNGTYAFMSFEELESRIATLESTVAQLTRAM